LLNPEIPAAAGPAPLPSRHGLPVLLASLAAVGPFCIDAYLPSMNEIGRLLHASPYLVQMTLTAYMAPFALMMLWHGAISDAVGRRRVVLWGVALFALATAGCAVSRSIGALLAFRVLQGMTAGAGMVVGRAIVRDCYHGAEAQRVMSRVSLTFAIAPAVAPVIGGWLQAWFGWRAVFIFVTLFAAAAWFVCRAVLPETLPPERRQSLHPVFLARSYWRVMTSGKFVAACVALSCNFTGIFIYITSAPVFLMQHLGISETGFLWLFGPITVGSATGAWISGRTAGRLTPRRTLAIAYGIMIVSAGVNLAFHALHRPALPWSILPLSIYSCGMGLAFPCMTILALDLFPSQRGLAASCQSFIQTSGAAMNAVIAPLVWGSVLTLNATAGAAVAISVVALIFFLRSASPPDDLSQAVRP
jgi:DHA1 family bicyclomycin/chloramphenicol resistance-like MFS transporter